MPVCGDIGEWLWTGDYVWQRSDRRGRLGLVTVVDDGAARFLVVGDNSPLMNMQVVADPRPAIMLIDMSTLWPSFMADMALLVAALLAVFGWLNIYPVIPSILAAGLVLVTWCSSPPSSAWKFFYVGQSGFDERNFNISLTREPRLWNSGWTLRRMQTSVSGSINVGERQEVLFFLVDGKVTIGDVLLHHCHRVGALDSKAGPYLMDAQVCAVKGEAEILLGNRDAAAAVAVQDGDKIAIIVLDSKFLSQSAPDGNTKWILERMTSGPKIPHLNGGM